MHNTVHSWIPQHQGRVEHALEQRLPAADDRPGELHEAMRYAVLGSGKRLRPLLAYAAGAAVDARPRVLDVPACAVELIHAYSLVHDDLPAMDDDDLRRGKPTCHKVYGEAMAILAGDALQALALQLLAADPDLDVPAERRLRMTALLAEAAGSRGMAGGQAIDLSAVGQQLSVAELETMHNHKTGALIRASCLLGALSQQGVEQQALDALDEFSTAIGLAFQIRDDILDVEGETTALGKPQGSDMARNKPTYPALLGLDEAKSKAAALHDQAMDSLSMFSESANALRHIAAYIVDRAS